MEASDKYGNVSKPTWGEVWIVGGGPSLSDFDFSRLRNQQVLSVNGHALRHFVEFPPTAVALFSLDNNWVRRNRNFLAEFPGEKFVALPLETWPDCGEIPGVTYLRWSHDQGLSEDPGTICCGGHSGYGALNLAFLKGCNLIHLVGYDLNPAENEQYQFWTPYYRSTAPQLKRKGVRVINHNPNSFIDAFPKEC